MPKLTKKKVISLWRTDVRKDGRTDPNYRKALLLKICEYLLCQYNMIVAEDETWCFTNNLMLFILSRLSISPYLLVLIVWKYKT